METHMDPLFIPALESAGFRPIAPENGDPIYFFRRVTASDADYEIEVLMQDDDTVRVEIRRAWTTGTDSHGSSYWAPYLRAMPPEGMVLFFAAVVNSVLDSAS